MDEKDFVYWLQGFVELANTDTISEAQWSAIKSHLQLVFMKQTNTPIINNTPVISPYNITCQKESH